MISVVAVAIIFGVSGFTYETLASIKALEDHPAPGKLVEINRDNILHIHEQGQEEGGPIIVIEAGGGSWSLAWSEIQTELSADAKVITYDRAGLGWSGELITPRTADQITTELKSLLIETGNTGPYILVGYSLSGLYNQVFAQKFANDVAGMVFVDMRPPAIDDQFPMLKENIQKEAKNMSLYKGLEHLFTKHGY